MGFKKIENNQTQGKWISDLADTPSIGAVALKESFDKINKEVTIPTFNNLVDELQLKGARDIGIEPILGIGSTKVQGALSELKTLADNRYTKTQVDDIAKLKADKSETYTKTQVDDITKIKADKAEVYTKIQSDNMVLSSLNESKTYTDQKVVAIGASDMQTAVYDKGRRNIDIFDYADSLANAKADKTALENIDGGMFTDSPKLAVHQALPYAHRNIVADGNINVSPTSQTLDEHIMDSNAHTNIILDGNEN
ncbi:MAG: hypothetical protein RR806_06365 [Oscillospiraceae bacterium]